MYNTVLHQGKLLTEWQKELKFEYSLGELYRMASEGCDFSKLVLRNAGTVTIDQSLNSLEFDIITT